MIKRLCAFISVGKYLYVTFVKGDGWMEKYKSGKEVRVRPKALSLAITVAIECNAFLPFLKICTRYYNPHMLGEESEERGERGQITCVSAGTAHITSIGLIKALARNS